MLELTIQNFNKEVIKSEVPVLVDMWAPWCGPCRILGPIIEELAKEYHGRAIKIAKLNVDEAGELASKYGVMSIPTLIFFKNGQVIEQLVGVPERQKLQAKLRALIGN